MSVVWFVWFSALKLLFINQFYLPAAAATAQMLADLAEALVQDGYDVTVLCAERWDVIEDDDERMIYDEIGGVKIRRLVPRHFGHETQFQILLSSFGFHYRVWNWLMDYGAGYDIIISLTQPPWIGMLGRLVKGVKHISWIMHLHPDSGIELGELERDRPIWKTVDMLNTLRMRYSDAVVATGNDMRQRLINKGVSDERLHVIRHWGHTDRIYPIDSNAHSIRDEVGLTYRFVVMYSGNAGIMHCFDAVCEAMELLRDDKEIVFLFVGGGVGMQQVKAFAEETRLDNVSFQPYYIRGRLVETLTMADIHLVTMRHEVVGCMTPSKTYGVMASGRPLIFVGPESSEVADEIKHHACGLVVNPESTDSLVQAIYQLKNDHAERTRMGVNARKAAVNHFSHLHAVEAWKILLNRVHSGSD